MRVFSIRKPQKFSSWTVPKKEELIKGLVADMGLDTSRGIQPTSTFCIFESMEFSYLPIREGLTVYTASEALQLQIKWEVLVPEILNYFYNKRWQQKDQWCYARVKTAEVRNCQRYSVTYSQYYIQASCLLFLIQLQFPPHPIQIMRYEILKFCYPETEKLYTLPHFSGSFSRITSYTKNQYFTMSSHIFTVFLRIITKFWSWLH